MPNNKTLLFLTWCNWASCRLFNRWFYWEGGETRWLEGSSHLKMRYSKLKMEVLKKGNRYWKRGRRTLQTFQIKLHSVSLNTRCALFNSSKDWLWVIITHKRKVVWRRAVWNVGTAMGSEARVTCFETQRSPLIAVWSSVCSSTFLQLSFCTGKSEMRCLHSCCGYSMKMCWKALSRTPALSSCSKNLAILVTARHGMM